jgi:hypothetical protein
LGDRAASGLVSTQRPAQRASDQSRHFDFGVIITTTSQVIVLK